MADILELLFWTGIFEIPAKTLTGSLLKSFMDRQNFYGEILSFGTSNHIFT